ncbi:MAG: SDR family NAD(P)-dependent oxidoreductase [Gammaproteobacteria bacterium]
MATLRTALVTGGNRGIGFAIVAGLARLGYHGIVGARDLAAAKDAIKPLLQKGLALRCVELDIASKASIDTALATLNSDGSTIDALINNAGVLHEGDLMMLTDAEIEESVAVHLLGPLRLVRGLAPSMIARGYGRIVNVSSGWGAFAEGLEGPEMYGVTKAALNALTVRLAKDLPRCIKVNALCPGWVRTRMGGESATVSPEQAAETAVWLATLPDTGPTGGYFRDRMPVDW